MFSLKNIFVFTCFHARLQLILYSEKNGMFGVFQGSKTKQTNNNKNSCRIKPVLNRRKGNLERINDLLGVFTLLISVVV